MLDVAIDMHLIPCHSKKLGSDLRGGERKSGTNRFKAYITAQVISSMIGDIGRFNSPDGLCSYAGLAPSVRSSAGTVHHGRITHRETR